MNHSQKHTFIWWLLFPSRDSRLVVNFVLAHPHVLASSSGMDDDQAKLTLLIAVLFPIGFGAMWCGICLLLSVVGGWRRLAAKYRTYAIPEGKKLGGLSGRVGGVNYNHVLTVWRSGQGLHLSVWPMFRPGHPPLFIPWQDIHEARRKRVLWMKCVAFDVGDPRIATVQLSERVFVGRLP